MQKYKKFQYILVKILAKYQKFQGIPVKAIGFMSGVISINIDL